MALSTVQHPRTQPRAHILQLGIPRFFARGLKLSLKTPQSPSRSCSRLSKTGKRGTRGVTPGGRGAAWGSVLLLLPPQKSSSRNSAAEIESASGRDISSWFLRRAPGLPVVPRQLAALNVSLYFSLFTSPRAHLGAEGAHVPPAPSPSSFLLLEASPSPVLPRCFSYSPRLSLFAAGAGSGAGEPCAAARPRQEDENMGLKLSCLKGGSGRVP